MKPNNAPEGPGCNVVVDCWEELAVVAIEVVAPMLFPVTLGNCTKLLSRRLDVAG